MNIQQKQTQQGGVVISSNPTKTREMINKDGDIIDPRTKRVIRKKTEEEKK